MAVRIVARIFIEIVKSIKIYAVGYTFYSQNTFLAVLIEASGCKKCSHIIQNNCKVQFIYAQIIKSNLYAQIKEYKKITQSTLNIN